MPHSSWSRRDVLRSGLAGSAGLMLGGFPREPERLPTRALGKTGVRVPILGFGTAPMGVKRTLKDAVELVHRALDLGITYLDTAPQFAGYGAAQAQLGQALKERRKEVFLVTKLWEPRMDDALRLLQQNLKELQTDHADLVYAHSIGSDKMDLGVVMGREGTMAALAKAKADGLTRFTGISGHNRPAKFLQVLERFDVDVMMNAVNLADQFTYGFEQKVWPVAARKGVGLVAMKIFGGMSLDPGLSARNVPVAHVPLAFRYAQSLPNITTVVVGMATAEELAQNATAARGFQPLTDEERTQANQLGRQLAQQWGKHFGEA